jgi:hypothetical protein
MPKRPKFTDKTLNCKDCAEAFVFSAGEQFFMWAKGLHDPLRCPRCRAIRKTTINPEARRQND